MKIASLTLAAVLMAGTAFAQSSTGTPTGPGTGTGTTGATTGTTPGAMTPGSTATGTPGNSAPGATSVTPMPGVSSSTGTTPDTGVVGRNTGTAAASGDRNQAVATTNQDATEPAAGANSFSEGQARGRIEDKGYTNVTGLAKDDQGVWRGTATKDGQSAQVWLDYKGNIGTGRGSATAGATTGTTGATGGATTGTTGTTTTR